METRSAWSVRGMKGLNETRNDGSHEGSKPIAYGCLLSRQLSDV